MKNNINKRKSTILFFVVSYAFTIFTFSVGFSAINSQKEKMKKISSEYNKNLVFSFDENTEVEEINSQEILNILEKEKVCTILKRYQDDGNVVETYGITNGELYKEDMKVGEYFSKEDFKSKEIKAVVSNTFLGKKELEIREGEEIKKIEFKDYAISYEKEPKITIPLDIFKKFKNGIDFNDPTLTLIINGEKKDLDKAINSLNSYIKNNNKKFSLNVYDYMTYDIEAEWKALMRTTILIIFVTLISSVGIAFLWVESRKKEIIMRKVVGANNLDVSKIFFKELFKIALIAMIISLVLQYTLATISGGYILNMNMKMNFTNIISSLFITLGATLVTSIPFLIYLTKIQPIEMLREE